MKRHINMKIAIPVMGVILILLVIVKALGILGIGTLNSGTRTGFVGNDGIHKFNGTYHSITGTFSHSLSPSKDSHSVHCEIQSKSGSLYVVILEKDTGDVIFEQEISKDAEFDVAAEGKVKISLTTQGHEGSYLFQY